jgi:hypothetical protein
MLLVARVELRGDMRWKGPTTSTREHDYLDCRVLSCRWVPLESVFHCISGDEVDSIRYPTENTRLNSRHSKTRQRLGKTKLISFNALDVTGPVSVYFIVKPALQAAHQKI